MTLHLGNVPANATLYIPFHTFNSSGASVTLTGLATSDILIYKNGSATQRASTAGFTLLDTDGIDFDGLTGIHGFSVDLSDNTDAGFYAVGSFYWVVISSVTVNSQTVSFVAATFRIVAAEAVTGKPKVDVDAFGGTGGTFSAGRPEVNTTHVAGTAQTAGDIVADTNDIQSRLPAALVSGRMDASVGAMAANTLTASALAADAVSEIQAGLSTLTAAQVNAEVVDALSVDTYAQPGQEAPAATTTLAKMLAYLYKAWRNRSTQTASQYALYADDATTLDQKAAVSDNGTTLDRGEVGTGP